jgi:hypothetical protein
VLELLVLGLGLGQVLQPEPLRVSSLKMPMREEQAELSQEKLRLEPSPLLALELVYDQTLTVMLLSLLLALGLGRLLM